MVATTGLIGRDREAERLVALVDALPRSGGGLLLLGEAGMGKTLLTRAAVDRAKERGVAVVSVTALEAEMGLPYAAFQQILHPFRSALASMRAKPRAVLERILGLTDGDVPELFSVAVAALELMTDLAGGEGLVVVVDDAHWLDEPTARVLAFVARRVAVDPLCLLLALRPHPPSPLTKAGLDEMVLDALPEGSARELLALRRGVLTDPEVAVVLQAAGGNPLALLELSPSTSPADAVTLGQKVEAAFLSRVSSASAGTRAVLLLAALDDSDSLEEVATAAKAAGMSRGAFEAAIDEAVALDTVVLSPGRYAFRHPLIRSALVSSATPGELRCAHAALVPATRSDADRNVWHGALATSGPDEAIGDALEAAAERAAARASLGLAHRAAVLAADLTARPEVAARRRLRSAQHAAELGRPDLVSTALADTDALLLSDRDGATLALLQVSTSPQTLDPGRLDRLLAHGRQVLRAGELELATAIVLTAAEHLDAGGREAVRGATDLARDVADRLSPEDPRRLVVLASVDPARYVGEIADAIAQIDPDVLTEGAEMLIRVRSNVDADPLLAQLQRRLVESYRRRGRLRSIAFMQPVHAWNEIALADYPEAIRAAEEGTRLAGDVGVPRWGTGTLLAEAYVAALRGDPGAAAAAIEESERGAMLAGSANVLTGVQLTKGMNHLAQGRYESAFSAFRRPFDPGEPSHHPVQMGWALGDLAEVAAHLGRVDDIRPLFDRDTSAPTTPWQAMAESYAQPFLAVGVEETEAAFERALTGPVRAWPTYRARLMLEHSAWLRRHRRVTEARENLEACVETFDALAMRPWSVRARRELRAAGGDAHRREPAAWESLSAQELQVARLAAHGLSNREIGERLFLSRRTVGSHLYSLFPKLGISNRSQLGPLLRE